MKHLEAAPLSLLVACLTLLSACGAGSGAPQVSSPEEFVKLYAQAWATGSVDRILAMESHVLPGATPVGASFDAIARRKEISEDLERRGFGFLAWSTTRFESAREHGDHVHVVVRIGGATSDIVLLKEGGTLKLAEDPRTYD